MKAKIVPGSRLPLDMLTTNGNTTKPTKGDLLTWEHYNLDTMKWDIKEQATFGSDKYAIMIDKYNALRSFVATIR